MPESKRPLKVFLCHASMDKPKVRELYRYLKKRGIQPWFDEEDLVGGQDWQVEIPKALATSDAIIICLTKNSVDKEGYIQKEIKFALDKALEMPEGRIFLIPVKFEECEVPFTLSRYQWVDLTVESGYAKMMKALKFRASQLERLNVELTQPPLVIEGEKPQVKEQATHEKTKRQAAVKAFITYLSSKAAPFLRVIGIIVIIIILFWVGSWGIPILKFLVPTASTLTLISPKDTLASPTATAGAQLITPQSIIPPEVMTGTWESSTGMRYTILWRNGGYEVTQITHPTIGSISIHSQLWENGVLTWRYILDPDGSICNMTQIHTDYIDNDKLFVSLQNTDSKNCRFLSYVSLVLNRVY